MTAGHLGAVTAAAHRRNPSPPSYTGPLDLTATPAVVAYGQRAMSAAKLGTAVYTIRRDSDDATQSFSSDLTTGAAPVASISAFIGGGSGFVASWVDQSGNSVAMIQADSATQPPWVAGSVPALGGLDSGSSLSSAFATSWTAAGPLTLFFVVNADALNNLRLSVESSDGFALFGLNVAGTIDFEINDPDPGDNFTNWEGVGSFSGLHLYEVDVDAAGVVTITKDGGAAISLTLTDGSQQALPSMPSAKTRLSMGGAAQRGFEAIIWPTLSSGDRLAIRQNIAAYYGITLS